MKYWCQFILAIFLVMLMTGFGMSQITTYPYVVDFENGGNIPPGWINDPNDSGKDWDFDTDAGHGAGFDHTTGSGYLAYVDDSFPHETDPTNLLSDTLDLTGLTSPTLSFWYWSFNDRSTPSEFAYLHIDVWDGSTWHMDVTDSIGQEAPEWRKRTVDLTPYQSAQTVVRFRVLETSSFYHDIGIDDVRVGEPQTDLTVSQFINFPSSAVANSTVNFDIEVSNVGATTITSDSLDLYLNGSLVSSFEYSTLSIGEKDTIAASVTASASGRDSVVAAVRLVSGDNNPANDTLGAAYTVLSTLPVPFTEMWDTTTFDPQKWPDITGSPEIIDSTGVSTGTFPYPVPSEPYFLSVNGDPVEVTSGFFDLSGVTDYVIALSESEHDLEPPESVALEYYSSGGTWEMLHLFEGTNNGFGTFEPFEQMAFLLPSDAYHGSFRFRFRGVDGLESTDEWFFDNIHLFSADSLASDIAALQLNQPQLTQLAQSQTGTTSGVVSEGWYRNFGPTNTGDVNVEITDDVGTSVFSDAITGVTIDPLSDTTFTFSAWDASGAAAGNYNIMTYTSNFNDGNSANDSAFASLELNKTMAYDDGNHTNNVAIISSGRSILGTRFTLTDDDTLTSVSMQITSSTIASDSFSIDIYEAAGDTPTVALARIFRGTYQDVSPLPALVQFAIAGTGLPLTAGDYYAIIDSDSSGNSNFPLGVSSSGLGAEYIPRRFGGASPGFNNGAWNFFEDVPNPVFATFTPIIRIGLQESVIHDYAVTEVFAEPCLLYNSTNTVYARVTNRGSEPESNVTVELWENGVFVSDALVSLNAGETDSVAFAYTPSDTGVVELKVVSMLSTDNYTINDTSTTYTRVTDTDALVFQDDFTDTTFTFSNWVITNDGGTDVWMVFEEPYPNSYTLPMTSSGNVLSADADEAGSGSSTLTTAIISLDLSAYDSVRLDFDSDWNAGGSDDTARVKISPDGGTTWITVLEYDGTDQRNEHLSLDLSGDLANAANAMIAFQSIQPGWDWWWTIDNVCVTGATVTPTAALPFWEGFNDTTLQIPQGWIQIDADGGDEIPGADWHLRGDTVSNVFPFEGAGYAANNFQAANSNGVIDEWLISPQFQSYQDGMELSFYLNHVDDIWDDSVMVLVSTGSSDPNDFTQIDYINCPITWTEFSYNLSNHGVSPGDNFYIAFRYLHFDGGSFGNNSNFFGLEDMHIDFPPAPPASKLLLSEIVVTPTEGEFVEIYNPNPDSVDLTNYYITDATFASGNTYYYQIVQGGGGGGGFADWHARFPAGAMIGPDEYQTIALAGDSLFFDLYNELPTYELFEDSTNFANDVPDMLEATPGSINNQGGLTNGDEMVVLYYWDGMSDLVGDVDYLIYDDAGAVPNEAVDKTGVSIDGPDPDTLSSTYLDDTPIANQVPAVSPEFGLSTHRMDYTEGNQVMSGGNGVTGADETSEDLDNTWTDNSYPSPNAPRRDTTAVFNPPRNLAALAGDGFVDLWWEAPLAGGGTELAYDDGTSEGNISIGTGSGADGDIAVRFTPNVYPSTILGIRVWFASTTAAEAMNNIDYTIWDGDGVNGPNNSLSTGPHAINRGGFEPIDVSSAGIQITQDDFFISFYEPSDSTMNMAWDTDSPSADRAWVNAPNLGLPWQPFSGLGAQFDNNVMIRAIVLEGSGPNARVVELQPANASHEAILRSKRALKKDNSISAPRGAMTLANKSSQSGVKALSGNSASASAKTGTGKEITQFSIETSDSERPQPINGMGDFTQGLLGYNIWRSTDGTNFNNIANVDSITLQYTDGTVTNGTTYYYYVTAVYDQGESGPSDTVMATPTSVSEDIANHETPEYLGAVTNKGNIGTLNDDLNQSRDPGFQWPIGTNQLFEGAIMVGIPPNHVSDAARVIQGTAQSTMDGDFQWLTNVDTIAHNADSTVLRATYDDSRADQPPLADPPAPNTPLPVRITQTTYSYTGAGNSGYLLYKLEVTNTGSSALNEVLIGMYHDWDINTFSTNTGQIFEELHQIPGVNNGNPFAVEFAALWDDGSPNPYLGIVPVSQNGFQAARVADNAEEIFPGGSNPFTETNKYDYMRNYRGNDPFGDPFGPADKSLIAGLGGPNVTGFDLQPGETVVVGMAIVGGADSAAFVANGKAAMDKWSELGYPIDIIPPVGIAGPEDLIPREFALDQNYPNPFNPTTTIKYALKENANVKLRIYNVLGQVVKTLVNAQQTAGFKTVQWDGTNEYGVKVSSGIYIYRIEANDFVRSRKMILLK